MNDNTQPIETQLEVLAPNALESMERAQIDIQINTAHKFPRILSRSKERMLELATLDEETAQSCFYRLSRQGKSIEGPSIRLAEIAASAFGNIRFGARIIADDGKQITAQGFCHDLESNVLSTIEVRRRITNREGLRYSDDMVVVTGNAACAIAARNAIFKVVPFALVKPIFTAAKQVAIGDITTLAERRTKMLKAFAAYGVEEKRVCAVVGKRGAEDIGLDELGTLIGIYTAIKDGASTVDEAFPAPKPVAAFGAALPAAAESPLPTTPTTLPATDETKVKKTTKKEKADVPPPRATPLGTLRNLMIASNVEEGPLLAHLFSKMQVEQGQTLDTLPEAKVAEICDSFLEIAQEMKKE